MVEYPENTKCVSAKCSEKTPLDRLHNYVLEDISRLPEVMAIIEKMLIHPIKARHMFISELERLVDGTLQG